jgi:hypothetical protein
MHGPLNVKRGVVPEYHIVFTHSYFLIHLSYNQLVDTKVKIVGLIYLHKINKQSTKTFEDW